MYDKPDADDRESYDEPDASTSGASAIVVPTPSHLATDSLRLGRVGNNHEIADKKTSQPRLFTFAPGVETTDDSREHQPFGSASQTKTLEATKNCNDYLSFFNRKCNK
jgi:hypothetical protein